MVKIREGCGRPAYGVKLGLLGFVVASLNEKAFLSGLTKHIEHAKDKFVPGKTRATIKNWKWHFWQEEV